MAKAFIKKIEKLYEGNSRASSNFLYTLLAIDVATLFYIIISTFFYGSEVVEIIDIIFGIYVLADYSARFLISDNKLKFTVHPLNIIDMVVILSFLAPLIGSSAAFLRSIRVLRLLRSLRLLKRLRSDFEFFGKNEDIVISSMNLIVFIFIMTEIVFVTQIGTNPKINNFIDAMYFTITTLTTTGFGDIILEGTLGRAISIIIMIIGVSLFIRLIQTIFRPSKVRAVCNDCGLFLHDRDAIHCKHCGKVIFSPSDGFV